MLKVLACLDKARNYGLTFSPGDAVFSVYCDADNTMKETDRRPIFGVAVKHGGVAAASTSRTQQCVILSTTKAEYVAMAEGARGCLSVESVLFFF